MRRTTGLAFLFLLVAATLGVADEPATIEVRFVDATGAVLTDAGAEVTVYDSLGQVARRLTLTPEPDGIHAVAAEVGEKLGFRVWQGEPTLAGAGEILRPVPPAGGVEVPFLGAPANDDCANAQAIGSLPATVAGTTLGASGPDVAAGVACGTAIDPNTPGVWYTVIGTGTQLTATTCPGLGGAADYDTKISVYCTNGACGDDCDSPLTCVAGNDDGPAGCTGFTSRVTWCSSPGVLYRIYVHGFNGSSGNFSLRVTDSGQSCTATVNCFPPPPLGACCNCLPNAPYNCTIGTEEDCARFNGEYQGGCTECLDTSGGTRVYNSVVGSVPIPGNNPTGVTLSQDVAESFFISDLNVGIGITHTWIGDLIIRVKHVPSGVEQELWTHQCGSTDNLNSTADDEGTNLSCASIATGGIDVVFWPPAVGGQGPLSVFDGLDANGTWEFFVNDLFGADIGWINRWQLTFQGGTPFCVADDDDDDDTACEACAPEADGKVTICHLPPGNPAGAQTIRVSPSALRAHCGNHGDTCGECGSRTRVVEAIETTAPQTGTVDLDARPGVNDDPESRDPARGARRR